MGFTWSDLLRGGNWEEESQSRSTVTRDVQHAAADISFCHRAPVSAKNSRADQRLISDIMEVKSPSSKGS